MLKLVRMVQKLKNDKSEMIHFCSHGLEWRYFRFDQIENAGNDMT